MPREPNHASAVGNKTNKVTKSTRIICLGHLATHIDAKVALMKARGFTRAEPMYAQTESLDEQKAKLRAAGPALLFVGGAMMVRDCCPTRHASAARRRRVGGASASTSALSKL